MAVDGAGERQLGAAATAAAVSAAARHGGEVVHRSPVAAQANEHDRTGREVRPDGVLAVYVAHQGAGPTSPQKLSQVSNNIEPEGVLFRVFSKRCFPPYHF